MEAGHEFDPSKIENIFQDFKGRLAGLIKALTTDVEEFFRQCDPEKEYLCLYGLPNETWKVSLPAAEVPPEIPEPVLGINFNRDRMSKKEWLKLVAAHSDSWLHSVAFYYVSLVVRSSAGVSDRARLFSMINDLPTASETVLGSFEKPSKEKSSATTHKSDTSKSPSCSKRGSESDIRASRGRSGRGGRIHKGLRIVEKVPEYDPSFVDEVFKDFKGSRAGMIKALTTEVDEFFQQCDPEKGNLCLYGYPDETWGVSAPFQKAPPEIPEPVSGINFARDQMPKKEWLNSVAFHCDSWLHYVAFYTATKFGLGKTERARLFSMTNDLPTICETLAKSFEKQIKDNSSVAEHRSNTSKSLSGSKTTGSKPDFQVKFSKFVEVVEIVEEEDVNDNPMCGICKDNDHSGCEIWICCDMCGKSFHGKCVKITQSRAARLKKYKCPTCCEGPSQ